MAILIETNEYQTPITKELLSQYPEEVIQQFTEIVNIVPFIKNLINPNRPKIEDLPRDKEGRAIVDITNPPIYKDTDYFRQAALFYLKNNCYTKLRPNSNPNSEYRKYWREELRRCREGLIRQSDGMYVTGFLYWFLNYCPMMVNFYKEGQKKAIRKESFGFFFEGIWWRSIYLYNAREQGHHAIELAKRGCAKSYFLATIMSHNLIVGESEAAHKRCITVLTAAQKEYLKDDKDGTLNKFIPELSFVIDNTPFPNLLLKNSPNEMSWQMGYKKPNGAIGGSMNQVLGVSAKDDSDKLRGKRGWILYEEMGTFDGLLELYDVTRKSVEDGDYTFACMYLVGCICAGTKVWTIDGRNINIEELEEEDGIVGFTDNLDLADKQLIRGITKEPIVSTIYKQPKECVRITLSNGNILECSIDHPILIQKGKYSHRKLIGYEEIFREAKKLKIGDRVLESRKVNIFGNNTLFDARLVGMLIGNGSYGSSVKYCSEDKELQDYVKSKYECKVFRTHITKKGNLYEEFRVNGIRGKLNDIGILGQTKLAKRLPINYQTLNEDNVRLLLSGLYDTDGSVCINKKDGYIYLTQSNKEILSQIQILWRKFGVIGVITKTNPTIKKDKKDRKDRKNKKDRNPWFTLTISGRYNCLNAIEVLNLLVPHKRDKLLEIKTLYSENPSKRLQSYPTDVLMYRIINIENIGVREVYNLTTGLSHTYLANNIITHNTANNKESSFLSAKKLLYAPNSYNIQSVPNVYDKKGSGKDVFGFFFPAYINRAGCYNKDGISDVIKALLQVLMARYEAKYGADPTSVLRIIAEDPITPAEAIIKVKDAYFPVAPLQERADTLDKNPSLYDDIYVGELYTTGTGEIEFRPTDDIPIRTYPVDNDTKGALEIYSMPKKDREGKVFSDRYIIGVDPYDNDQAESHSLYSIFVLDTFVDNLVAEYTGRTKFADEAHDMVLKLCIFYNAKALYESNKKGLYAYMEKTRNTFRLADTPEYLRDKQLVKYSSFGSNAKGVNVSANINNFANRLIKDWLLMKVPIEVKQEDGHTEIQEVPKLYTLKTRALIEEAIQFNPDINVDRIRALGILMLYREQYIIRYGTGRTESNSEILSKDYAGNDEFFTKNFDARHIGKQ